MKRFSRLALPLSLGILALSGYIPPQDRKYVDYFLKLEAAELFRTRAFLLTSSWAYVSQKKLEKVDMRFTYYRALDINQTRRLIVSVAQELVDKINSDSMLQQKKLLVDSFAIEQLRLEIRMDNAVSANTDTPTIRRVVLDKGVITYDTFRISTLFSGGSDTYKETFQYALMLLDEPTEFQPSQYPNRKQSVPVQDIPSRADVKEEVVSQSSALNATGSSKKVEKKIYEAETAGNAFTHIFHPEEIPQTSVQEINRYEENQKALDTSITQSDPDLIQEAQNVIFELFPGLITPSNSPENQVGADGRFVQKSQAVRENWYTIEELGSSVGGSPSQSATTASIAWNDADLALTPEPIYEARYFAFYESNPSFRPNLQNAQDESNSFQHSMPQDMWTYTTMVACNDDHNQDTLLESVSDKQICDIDSSFFTACNKESLSSKIALQSDESIQRPLIFEKNAFQDTYTDDQIKMNLLSQSVAPVPAISIPIAKSSDIGTPSQSAVKTAIVSLDASEAFTEKNLQSSTMVVACSETMLPQEEKAVQKSVSGWSDCGESLTACNMASHTDLQEVSSSNNLSPQASFQAHSRPIAHIIGCEKIQDQLPHNHEAVVASQALHDRVRAFAIKSSFGLLDTAPSSELIADDFGLDNESGVDPNDADIAPGKVIWDTTPENVIEDDSECQNKSLSSDFLSENDESVVPQAEVAVLDQEVPQTKPSWFQGLFGWTTQQSQASVNNDTLPQAPEDEKNVIDSDALDSTGMKDEDIDLPIISENEEPSFSENGLESTQPVPENSPPESPSVFTKVWKSLFGSSNPTTEISSNEEALPQEAPTQAPSYEQEEGYLLDGEEASPQELIQECVETDLDGSTARLPVEADPKGLISEAGDASSYEEEQPSFFSRFFQAMAPKQIAHAELSNQPEEVEDSNAKKDIEEAISHDSVSSIAYNDDDDTSLEDPLSDTVQEETEREESTTRFGWLLGWLPSTQIEPKENKEIADASGDKEPVITQETLASENQENELPEFEEDEEEKGPSYNGKSFLSSLVSFMKSDESFESVPSNDPIENSDSSPSEDTAFYEEGESPLETLDQPRIPDEEPVVQLEEENRDVQNVGEPNWVHSLFGWFLNPSPDEKPVIADSSMNIQVETSTEGKQEEINTDTGYYEAIEEPEETENLFR